MVSFRLPMQEVGGIYFFILKVLTRKSQHYERAGFGPPLPVFINAITNAQ